MPRPQAFKAELLPFVERLSRAVHDTWAEGRLREGWTWGPVRNDALLQHPCLVSYDALPDKEREYDRQTVQSTLEAMLMLGFEVQPPPPDLSPTTLALPNSAVMADRFPPPPPEPPFQRNKLFGKYALIQPLGAGGFGEVWRARDTGITQREVAIKSIRVQGDAFQREALRAEARIMAHIFQHPNIPVLYDVLESRDRLALVVEYIPGCDLDWLLANTKGWISWPDVLACMRGILAGLGHAHRYEVLHRDLKPRNVRIFNPRPHYRPIRPRDVKLLDFGLGLIWTRPQREDMDPCLPLPAPVSGTPEYMSPEQVCGEPLGPASDLYAVGLLLYELVTGRRPFVLEPGQGRLACMEAHRNQTPPDPRTWRPGLPEDLVTLLQTCLAKHPVERPPHTQALEAQLFPVLERLAAEHPGPTLCSDRIEARDMAAAPESPTCPSSQAPPPCQTTLRNPCTDERP